MLTVDCVFTGYLCEGLQHTGFLQLHEWRHCSAADEGERWPQEVTPSPPIATSHRFVVFVVHRPATLGFQSLSPLAVGDLNSSRVHNKEFFGLPFARE